MIICIYRFTTVNNKRSCRSFFWQLQAKYFPYGIKKGVLFVIHKTWFVFSLHCITSNYGQRFVFYKHHNCILYTTACIYIPLHVYMYHSMYIYICTTACIYICTTACIYIYIYIYICTTATVSIYVKATEIFCHVGK